MLAQVGLVVNTASKLADSKIRSQGAKTVKMDDDVVAEKKGRDLLKFDDVVGWRMGEEQLKVVGIKSREQTIQPYCGWCLLST